MADSGDIREMFGRLKLVALPWLLPRIVEIDRREWDDVLMRLRETPFDAVENAGLLLCLAFVTWLLGTGGSQAAEHALPIVFTAQFLAAAPLFILLAGPLYVRCWRRGLDREIERRRDRHTAV